jgi:phosphate transport system substrate-binding protein
LDALSAITRLIAAKQLGNSFLWGRLKMIGDFRPLALLALLGLLSLTAVAGEVQTGPLIFAGSGSNLAITQLLAEAYQRTHPEISIEVPKSIGSAAAIRAAAEGAISVGLISRPMKEDEKKSGLTVLPYARTVLVIGVRPTVPDDNITFDDLVNIYRGVKTRWSDGHDIIVLTRQLGDSFIEVLEREIPRFREAFAESQRAKRWITMHTDQEMNQTLAKTPYAIGFSSLGAMAAERLAIKPLQLNGVAPSDDNALSGRYPLILPVAFVFREDTLPPTAKGFVDFVLSAEGREMLRANGYLPGK